MKRNISFAKITLAAILFQSHFAVAESYIKQTNNDVNSAAALQPLVCQKVPSPGWNYKMNGSAPLVDDPACVRENNRRAQARGHAQDIQGTTSRVSTGDGTTLVAPKAPSYTCGSLDPYTSAYQSCQNSYNQAYETYKKDLTAYNNAQEHLKAGQVTAENAALAEQKEKTAAATLAEIKQKNDQGKKSFDVTGLITLGLGIAATVKGTACQATCAAAGTGCCAMAPYYFGVAAGMFLLNTLAKKQSAEHAASSANACASLNQISTTTTDCNTTGADLTTNQTVSYDPVTGKCSPAESEACKQAPTAGVAPPSTKDALKASGFASANVKDPYSVLPDGSIKLKNGKTYKASDFKDANALMATGMSAANAKSVMDALGAANFSSLANANKDLKGDPKKSSFSAGMLADGATTVVDINRAPTSDKTYSDQLEKKPEYTEERKPSSEGLAKEFNGELIGVAGDDIFLMMNRRYKLKSEQDSFIAQDRK